MLVGRVVAVTAIGLGLLSGCGSGNSTSTLTVYAAASRKKPLSELGRQFERTHPGVKVTFTFAGSADLVSQITQGAPGDVEATADEKTMERLVESVRWPESRQLFATNRLTLVALATNPARITALDDVRTPGLDLVLCAP